MADHFSYGGQEPVNDYLHDLGISAKSLDTAEYFRRDVAAAYLKSRYGFGAARTLAKLATVGGGPPMFHAGRMVLYRKADLDEWAASKIGPSQKSTSESQAPARRRAVI